MFGPFRKENPLTGLQGLGGGAGSSLVLVGTSEGEILALSRNTGSEAWRTKVSSEVLSSPREADDVVVVRTIDGKIFALDAIDGKVTRIRMETFG